jgi:hypothetical protein
MGFERSWTECKNYKGSGYTHNQKLFTEINVLSIFNISLISYIQLPLQPQLTM